MECLHVLLEEVIIHRSEKQWKVLRGCLEKNIPLAVLWVFRLTLGQV